MEKKKHKKVKKQIEMRRTAEIKIKEIESHDQIKKRVSMIVFR